MFGYSDKEILEITAKKKKTKRNKIIILILLVLIMAFSAAVAGLYYYYNVYSKPYGKYDLDKYITVGKYKGLPLNQDEVNITKKQVDEKVSDNVAATASIKEVTSGEVRNGDTINIDYVGTIDGEEFENSSAKDTTITIGSGEFVAGFESSLIGAKVGKKTKIHINFPKDYSKPNLAGKKVTYEVTINSKEEANVPEYNDEWVKENTEFVNTTEYEKSVKQKLYDKAKKEAKEEAKEKLWEAVVEDSNVKKYPKEEIKRIKDSTVLQYKMYAKQYKMKYSEFLEQLMGITEGELKEKLKSYSKDEVKQEEITYWIAKKEKISVSEEEYKKYIKDVLKEYGYTSKSFEEENGKSYEDYAGELNIYSEIYKEKVKNYIYKHAKNS